MRADSKAEIFIEVTQMIQKQRENMVVA